MPPGQASILVIHSTAPERDELRHQVEKLGYRTAVADSEAEALKSIAADRFDAALWDCSGPATNHLESLEGLKANSKNPNIPVVVVCPQDQMASVARFLDHGAADFILRPFDPVLLGVRLREVVERAQFLTRERERTEELERISSELRQSNEELKRFAYAASHDLQAPLRTITAHLQLLERKIGPKLTPEELPSLEFPIAAAMRMHQLIRDLLTYSQVSTHERNPIEVNCEDVLADVVEDLNLEIKDTGAVITHDPLPTLIADRTQFEQLLLNLVGNAIKYGRDEEVPRIHLGVQREKGDWHFWVKDNGEGIPAEYLSDVFKLFRRLHGDERPGTGLGLAICQRILDHLGGRIWVESEPGTGSTFHFTIPLAAGYSSKTKTALPR